MQHKSDAGTAFALDNGDEFYQAIYSLNTDDGEVQRVGDVDRYGVAKSRFSLNTLSIEWDGCNMWLVILDNQSDTHLYTVGMLTGIAEHVGKIRAKGVDFGYISSIEWDGQHLYGLGVWGDLLRIDRDTAVGTVVEPARHPTSASLGWYGAGRMEWADGVMYVSSGSRFDVLDLNRAHISSRFYDHSKLIKDTHHQIGVLLWANGRLHFKTLVHDLYAIVDGEPVWKFNMAGPRIHSWGRGFGKWKDMTGARLGSRCTVCRDYAGDGDGRLADLRWWRRSGDCWRELGVCGIRFAVVVLQNMMRGCTCERGK